MKIKLVRTTDQNVSVVKNFFLAYFYDLAQYDDNIVINAHGLPMWEPAGYPGPATPQDAVKFNWWIRDNCELYIITADEQPAGFVIICTDQKYLLPGIEYELLDFYITPKFRRHGIGRVAAKAAFDLHHGTWHVFQLPRNRPARTFWESVIGEYTGDNYEKFGDDKNQQRFAN